MYKKSAFEASGIVYLIGGRMNSAACLIIMCLGRGELFEAMAYERNHCKE